MEGEAEGGSFDVPMQAEDRKTKHLRLKREQKALLHIGGETRRCLKTYGACALFVGLYVGGSVVLALVILAGRV